MRPNGASAWRTDAGALARLAASPAQSDELASALSEALFCYVATFDEPYWDFIFRNMFFDADLALVTFLDFGFPDLYRPLLGELLRHHPVEVSLGALVASAIFEAARPKRFRRRREHRRAFELAKLTVEHVVSEPAGARVRVDAVRECARALYGLATTDGGALRQGWYLRAGPLIAQPSSKLATLA